MPLVCGVVLVGQVAMGCSDSGSIERRGVGPTGDVTSVTYRFIDSSVPPQFHRSIELVVDADTIEVTVDSYGDVLHTDSVPTPPEVWTTLVDDAGAIADLADGELPEQCDGGTGRTVRIEGDAEVEFSAGACRDPDDEELVARIDEWIEPVADEVPNLDERTDGRSPFSGN